jgi:hypothetical protein
MNQQPVLNADKKAQELIDLYNSMIGTFTAPSFLVMGVGGAGKTTLATTGRLPILYDMFDPKGMILFHTHPDLIKLREEGKVIIRFFGKEESHKPTEYIKWEKQWQADCRSGFLSHFGTYCIDSGTSMIEAISNQIIVSKGGKRLNSFNLEIQDYNLIYSLVMDLVKLSSSQGCDFIYLAHAYDYQNELTQEITTDIDTYNRLRPKIRKCFSEKYFIVARKSPGGIKYELLTKSAGRYTASTQLHGLNPVEEPNIKKLLQKAGLPTEDKPLFKLK